MPARITGIEGSEVFLARPTGLEWRSRWVSVRPATAWEQRQLAALAKLHLQRQRGPGPRCLSAHRLGESVAD